MKFRPKRWMIVVLICIVLLAALIVLLLHWMSGSSTGTVEVGKPSSSSQIAEPLKLTNAYFTATLPAGFTLKRQTDGSGTPTLLQVYATASGTQNQQFAATIGNLPSNGLSGVADYNLRVTQPDNYAPYQLPSLPAGAVAYRAAADPLAFTVFWPHGGRYAELGFGTDGAATEEQLQATYAQVLAGWVWQ
ncbi:MAG: hypothetical protein WDN27_04335 [Candidatus Saccharibacteria bacterium]